MKQASVSSIIQGGGKRRGAAQRQNAPPATPEAARAALRDIRGIARPTTASEHHPVVCLHARARPRASFDSADGRHRCTPKLHIEPVSMSVTTAAAGAAARGQALRSISGSLAMLAAMRRASSRVSSLAAARLLGSSSGRNMRSHLNTPATIRASPARGDARPDRGNRCSRRRAAIWCGLRWRCPRP